MYLWRLDEVNQEALRELIDRSVRVRKGIDRASAKPAAAACARELPAG